MNLNQKLIGLYSRKLGTHPQSIELCSLLVAAVNQYCQNMPEPERSIKCISRKVLQYLGTLKPREKNSLTLDADSIMVIIDHAINPSKFYKVELPEQPKPMTDGAQCPQCNGFTGILTPVTSTRMGTNKTGGQMYTCTGQGCNRMWPY
jgi:hypothetical protein